MTNGKEGLGKRLKAFCKFPSKQHFNTVKCTGSGVLVTYIASGTPKGTNAPERRLVSSSAKYTGS